MMSKVTTIFAAACISAVSLAMTTSVSSASNSTTSLSAGFVADTGAADRIEAGDRLRTLTQALSSAACHLHAGVDVEASETILETGMTEFSAILNALAHGDEGRGIVGVETHGRILRGIDGLNDDWAVMRDAFRAVLADATDAVAIQTVYDTTDPLMEKSIVLLSDLEGLYSNPTELLQSDMLLMEVAGRKAMTAQRLSYEACRIWSGSATDQQTEELKQLVNQFEFGVNALLKGAPELGLSAAPTDEIATKLEKAVGDWSDIKWKLERLADSGQITPEEATIMCRTLFDKMATMEKITHLYAEYSRRVY